MKYKKTWILICTILMTALLFSTTAFAIDESEVQSAIAASGKDAVAGNVFIWFLCAVAFLKISQKIDSFMTSLGINVGRTGGSMLGELMIAGRAIGAAARATGSAAGSVFNRASVHSSSTTTAAGQGFSGTGGGVIGVAQRAAGKAAVSSATGKTSGLRSVIGGAMFASSMKNNGKFAADVVSTVATGSISSVGTISGPQASEALTSYLGYGKQQASSVNGAAGDTSAPGVSGMSGHPGVHSSSPSSESVGGGSVPSGFHAGAEPVTGSPGVTEDTITLDGGAAAGAEFSPIGTSPERNASPQSETVHRGGDSAGAGAVSIGSVGSAGSVGGGIKYRRGGSTGTSGSVGSSSGSVPGSSASGGSSSGNVGSAPDTGTSIPPSPPVFRDVEIGGGRITGYETPAEGGAERQFAMYNAEQYMEPTGSYEKVQTVDGQSWYKQYAEPTVQKTPYEDPSGQIKYDQKIVEQLPQIPKRKDRV